MWCWCYGWVVGWIVGWPVGGWCDGVAVNWLSDCGLTCWSDGGVIAVAVVDIAAAVVRACVNTSVVVCAAVVTNQS